MLKINSFSFFTDKIFLRIIFSNIFKIYNFDFINIKILELLLMSKAFELESRL